MKYDPESKAHREALAHALCDKLAIAGFSPITRKGTYEALYSRTVEGTSGKISVFVFTTIEPYSDGSGFSVRSKGSDAIRVAAVYKSGDGRERGLANAERRTFRVGQVDSICERMLSNMRGVYKVARNIGRCRDCNAPVFLSKKGRETCADLCWLKGSRSPESALVEEVKSEGFSSFSM